MVTIKTKKALSMFLQTRLSKPKESAAKSRMESGGTEQTEAPVPPQQGQASEDD